MAKFVMKGYQGKRYACAISATKLEIRGHFHMQGPAPVDNDGGVPEWVDELFELDKSIETLAIVRENGSVVYSRFKD